MTVADQKKSSADHKKNGNTVVEINIETTDDKAPITDESSVNSSNGIIKSACNFCTIFCGGLKILGMTIGFLVTLAVFLTPFAMVIMGSLYVNDCPAEPMIPIFDIVGGLLFIALIGIAIFNETKLFKSFKNKIPYIEYWIPGLLISFLLAWIAAGGYWTFTVDTRNCDNTIYLFTFYLLDVIFFALLCGLLNVSGSGKSS